MPVVVLPEMVDVDHQQSELSPVALGALDLACQGFFEEVPVRDSGQRIGGRDVFDLCLQPAVILQDHIQPDQNQYDHDERNKQRRV